MEAEIRTLGKIFQGDIRFLVPMFQRPYVWTQEEQWDPLWEDVETLAEEFLQNGGGVITPHFLGAIVVAQQNSPTGDIEVRHVIDGQQRLTTLQLLIDAVEEVVRHHGSDRDSKRLRKLILNDIDLFEGDDVFKIWPTNVDQDVFRAAMDDDAQVPDDYLDRNIAQAHNVFKSRAASWAEPDSDPDKSIKKLEALATVLRDYLQIAVIDLAPDDNDQAIFETLNARGTPLLASDLIKNQLLRQAADEGLDAESLYKEHWINFDTEDWREDIALGRIYWPRLDVFLYRWMTMELAREVPTQRLFSEFINIAKNKDLGPEQLMADLARHGSVYRQLDQTPEDQTPTGRFFYRWRTTQANVLSPLLMWMYANESELGQEQLSQSLSIIESWLIRRLICRSSTKGYTNFVHSLLGDLKNGSQTSFSSWLASRLDDASAIGSEWPSDSQFKTAMLDNPLYRQLSRGRLRMFLEALEDHLRESTGKTEDSCPKDLTIEHVMPQQWHTNWPINESAADEEIDRREVLIHTVGNLTLVTQKLNPSLSNSAWAEKKPALIEHSVLNLKNDIVLEDDWQEEQILSRSQRLAEIACEVWPRL